MSTALCLFGQLRGSYDVAELIKWVIIIAACCGIVYVALQYFGVTIPAWFVKIVGICVVAAVAIVGVRFLVSL